MITLRDFTIEEWEQWVPLSVNFMRESQFADLTFDYSKGHSFMINILQRDDYFVKLAEVDDQPAGFIVGFVEPFVFSWDLKGEDILQYVVPSKRRQGIGQALAQAFIDWCEQKGCKRVHFLSGSGINRESAAKLYEKVGGEHIGDLYAVRMNGNGI